MSPLNKQKLLKFLKKNIFSCNPSKTTLTSTTTTDSIYYYHKKSKFIQNDSNLSFIDDDLNDESTNSTQNWQTSTRLQTQSTNHLLSSTQTTQKQLAFTNLLSSSFTTQSLASDSNENDNLSNEDSLLIEEYNRVEETKSESKQKEQIVICCRPYTAKYEGDITITYSQRLKLLQGTIGSNSSSNQFVLVQIIGTFKCGYVPRRSIESITDFLDRFI
jgi:hypothetical protein